MRSFSTFLCPVLAAKAAYPVCQLELERKIPQSGQEKDAEVERVREDIFASVGASKSRSASNYLKLIGKPTGPSTKIDEQKKLGKPESGSENSNHERSKGISFTRTSRRSYQELEDLKASEPKPERIIVEPHRRNYHELAEARQLDQASSEVEVANEGAHDFAHRPSLKQEQERATRKKQDLLKRKSQLEVQMQDVKNEESKRKAKKLIVKRDASGNVIPTKDSDGGHKQRWRDEGGRLHVRDADREEQSFLEIESNTSNAHRHYRRAVQRARETRENHSEEKQMQTEDHHGAMSDAEEKPLSYMDSSDRDQLRKMQKEVHQKKKSGLAEKVEVPAKLLEKLLDLDSQVSRTEEQMSHRKSSADAPRNVKQSKLPKGEQHRAAQESDANVPEEAFLREGKTKYDRNKAAVSDKGTSEEGQRSAQQKSPQADDQKSERRAVAADVEEDRKPRTGEKAQKSQNKKELRQDNDDQTPEEAFLREGNTKYDRRKAPVASKNEAAEERHRQHSEKDLQHEQSEKKKQKVSDNFPEKQKTPITSWTETGHEFEVRGPAYDRAKERVNAKDHHKNEKKTDESQKTKQPEQLEDKEKVMKELLQEQDADVQEEMLLRIKATEDFQDTESGPVKKSDTRSTVVANSSSKGSKGSIGDGKIAKGGQEVSDLERERGFPILHSAAKGAKGLQGQKDLERKISDSLSAQKLPVSEVEAKGDKGEIQQPKMLESPLGKGEKGQKGDKGYNKGRASCSMLEFSSFLEISADTAKESERKTQFVVIPEEKIPKVKKTSEDLGKRSEASQADTDIPPVAQGADRAVIAAPSHEDNDARLPKKLMSEPNLPEKKVRAEKGNGSSRRIGEANEDKREQKLEGKTKKHRKMEKADSFEKILQEKEEHKTQPEMHHVTPIPEEELAKIKKVTDQAFGLSDDEEIVKVKKPTDRASGLSDDEDEKIQEEIVSLKKELSPKKEEKLLSRSATKVSETARARRPSQSDDKPSKNDKSSDEKNEIHVSHRRSSKGAKKVEKRHRSKKKMTAMQQPDIVTRKVPRNSPMRLLLRSKFQKKGTRKTTAKTKRYD